LSWYPFKYTQTDFVYPVDGIIPLEPKPYSLEPLNVKYDGVPDVNVGVLYNVILSCVPAKSYQILPEP